MSFFVTADGGLTTAGYVGCVVLMVALVVIASVLSAQKSKGTGMDARKLAFCAMGMALAFVTSYVKRCMIGILPMSVKFCTARSTPDTSSMKQNLLCP